MEKIISNAEIEIIDINDYEMPIYSSDREDESGIPESAHQFYTKIGKADALLIAFAEHNGYYTAAYKNLFDWASRIDQKVYQNKPSILLATSPGGRGAANVLEVAKTSAPHFGMEVKASLSIPAFYDNFDLTQGHINNAEINEQLEIALASLK